MRTEQEIQEALASRKKEESEKGGVRCAACNGIVNPITMACRCFHD